MRLLVASIFDSKAGIYSPPMVFKTKGEAIRSFTDAVRDPQLPFGKHPGDYRLFEIGEWDDVNGTLFHQPPASLIGADELG